MTLTDRLARWGGARPDVIDGAPGDRPKFVALALVIISTAALSATSAAFALVIALGLHPAVAIAIGLAWGLVIFNLDRLLVVSMPYQEGRSVRDTLLLALPRVLLALVIGTVISTPLTLQIFDKEIQAELVVMQNEEKAAFAARLDADPRFSNEDELRDRIAADQETIAAESVVDVTSDPDYQAAAAEVETARAAYAAAEAAYQAELDGSGGTGVRGQGDVADGKQIARDIALADLRAAEARLAQAASSADSALSAQAADRAAAAQADLKEAQAQLDTLLADRAAEELRNSSAQAASDGLLARMTALWVSGLKSPLAMIAHIMLALLFIFVELLPVAMKTLMNLGKPSAYDQLAAIRDKSTVSDARVWARKRVEETEFEAQVHVDAAEHRAGLQLKQHKRLNTRVAAKQTEAIDHALDVWGKYATRRTIRQVQDWEDELEAAERSASPSAPSPGKHSTSYSSSIGLTDDPEDPPGSPGTGKRR